eukprot:13223827-Ditylum_brightwellii.AAC.1
MEEDLAAAKQFLGWDLLEEDTEGEGDTNMKSTSKTSNDSQNQLSSEESAMSSSSIAILGFMGIVLTSMLVLLSFDPMSANNVFTSVEGVEPPMDMPLRSW